MIVNRIYYFFCQNKLDSCVSHHENITRLMDDNIKVEAQLLSEEQKLNNERTLEESLFKSIKIK